MPTVNEEKLEKRKEELRRRSYEPTVIEVHPSRTANRLQMEALSKTALLKTILSSGRAIDDLPLPEGALGLPEVVFEDLIDEEVIKRFCRATKPV